MRTFARQISCEGKHARGPVLVHVQERGSGTVLAVAAIGVLLVLATAGLHLGAAATAAHRARTTADLSALAGATALQEGWGAPCARAAEVAGRNHAQLIACTLGVGESVTVRVSTALPTHWLAVPDRAVASARAGPSDAARSKETDSG
ncbi:MAG: Rv3654c family TadE-like protein [Knoellia sp.]